MSLKSLTADRIAQLSPEKRERLKAMLAAKGHQPTGIKPRPRDQDNTLPLSFAQQGMWLIDQMGEMNTVFNQFRVFRLQGTLDHSALSRTMETIISRHESLRTVIENRDGKPFQKILPPAPYELDLVDLASFDAQLQQEKIQDHCQSENETPIAIATGPLLRMKLLKLSETEHILLLNMHHVITDAHTSTLLMAELQTLYQAYVQQKPNPLPPIPLQYADYALWQRNFFSEERLAKERTYWREKMAGAPPLSGFPCDFPRPSQQDFRGDQVSGKFEPELTQALRLYAQQAGVTLNTLILAGFNAFLYRYTQQADLVVGMAVANRDQPGTEKIIGFLANQLPVRSQLTPQHNFQDCVRHCHATVLEALAHKDLPFDFILDAVQPDRDPSHTPLFQTIFVFQPVDQTQGKLDHQLTMTPFSFERHIAKTDLNIQFMDRAGQILFSFDYATALYERASMQRLVRLFLHFLPQLLESPDKRIATLPLLDPAERQRLIETVGRSTKTPAKATTLLHLFHRAVAQFPQKTAMFFEGQTLTYNELDQQANRLAQYLMANYELGPGKIAAILANTSLERIVAIVAILKTGAAYLPIHESQPTARTEYMLADCQPVVLLTESEFMFDLDLDIPAFALDLQFDSLPDEATCPQVTLAPEHLAYIIYTSGTTGQPKGVMVPHRGPSILVQYQMQLFDPANSRMLQFASLGFDAAVPEIFAAFGLGGTLYLPPKEALLPGPELLQYFNEHRIQHTIMPPALLAHLDPQQLPHLRCILSMGERCGMQLVNKWAPGRAFHNGYGPTENSIGAAMYVCDPSEDRDPPLGPPLPHVQTYVLDTHLNLLPQSVAGELCVAGDGLAWGYQNQPALTARAFLPDPFSMVPGARLYKTGDKVRVNPDLTLGFLGRVDFQVKIRGFRIEPEEIDKACTRFPGVEEAVVDLSEDGQSLVAYVVPNPGELRRDEEAEENPETSSSFSTHALRQHLEKNLPAYMVPSYFCILDQLPLTANGKVDRKALPRENLSVATEAEGRPPQSPTECFLADLFSEILQVTVESVKLHFFAAGGHSLLATQIIARVGEKFGVLLPLRAIFSHPTLEAFAAHIDEQVAAQASQQRPALVARADGSEKAPLSYAQQRLWVVQQLGGDLPFYNIPLAFKLIGPLNLAALQAAFDLIISRHEILRTCIGLENGSPYQKVLPQTAFPLEITEPTEMTDEAQTTWVHQQTQAPFDLQHDLPLRCALLKLGEQEHLIALTMHHLVSDGWSLGKLLAELSTTYTATTAETSPQLPHLPIQYGDYAAWQRQWLQGDTLTKQLDFWSQHLASVPQQLALPWDFERPAVQSFAGAQQAFRLDQAATTALQDLAQNHDATLFMTVGAALQMLLAAYSGQDHFALGTVVANRDQAEVEHLIGFFVNTLVMRADVSGNPSFRELLERVKENAQQAFEHQDVPFEMVLDHLGVDRNTSKSPLFQVMFTLHHDVGRELSFPNLQVQKVATPHETAKFDLTIAAVEDGHGLGLVFEYSTQLFRRETIVAMGQRFVHLLNQLARSTDQTLADLRRSLPHQANAAKTFQRQVSNYPATTPIALFERQVAKSPGADALILGDQTLDYQTLNLRANQLAHFLIRQGLKPGDFVAFFGTRDLASFITQLAIAKSGAVYVPLDPQAPPQRQRVILEQVQPSLVLGPQHQAVTGPWTFLPWDQPQGLPHDLPSENPCVPSSPEHLAYVMFTSGSTGTPKGVMVPNRGVVSLVLGTSYFKPIQSLLQAAPLSFDAATFELWATWLHGGRCVVLESGAPITESIDALVQKYQIDTFWLTGGLFNQWIDTSTTPLPSVKQILTGGEAASTKHFQKAKTRFPQAELVNGYGPTEATTFALTHAYTVSKEATPFTVPLGRPLENRGVYILDAQLFPCPENLPGELNIEGAGLALGYLGNPRQTARAFVPHPFSPSAGARLYKTGDTVRQAGNALYFLGRQDKQIKLRGFRIELEEIRQVLVRHADVAIAHILLVGEGENRQLVGYWEPITQGAQTFNPRSYLASQLPTYMVPSRFVEVREWPLTPNGKLDHAALQQLEPSAINAPQEPSNALERQLQTWWAEVLDRPITSVAANFFELGGNSLNAVRLQLLLKEAGHELTLVNLFEHSTIASQAAFLANLQPQSLERQQERGKSRKAALLRRKKSLKKKDDA